MPSIAHSDAFHFDRPVDSFWEASAEPLGLDLQALHGDAQCDVAIIGAGFTGLAAAIELAGAQQRDVRILEAATPGWGASGRNGGFACIGGHKRSYESLIRDFGLEETQKFYSTMREAVELVRENCRSHGIDAAYGADGEISLAHLESRMEELKEERDFIGSTFGEKMELLTKTDLMERGLWGPTFHGGLFSSTGFGVHPLRYARGLARAAVKAGATIHPLSPVTRWHEENGWHSLETPQGRLRARQVIVATNGFTQEEILTPLEGRLLPALSSIIVTRPLSEEECRLQGWTSTVMAYDTRNLLHYFRLLPDRRFLFGGRGGTDSAASGEASLRDLMTQSFHEMFPAWAKAEITHFWRGFVCLTYDLLPYVGALNDRKTVWTAIAYHGNGVALASWSGRALARLMSGNGKAANLPAPMARRLKRFPLPALRPFYLKGAYLWFGFNDSR